MNINYYDKIKRVREFRNYTQEYMAANLGISQRSYSSIENGKTQLTVERLQDICKMLDVSIMEILELESSTIFNNNFNNNASHNKGNLVFKKDNISEIKRLYERIIQMKEDEIVRLREKIESTERGSL